MNSVSNDNEPVFTDPHTDGSICGHDCDPESHFTEYGIAKAEIINDIGTKIIAFEKKVEEFKKDIDLAIPDCETKPDICKKIDDKLHIAVCASLVSFHDTPYIELRARRCIINREMSEGSYLISRFDFNKYKNK